MKQGLKITLWVLAAVLALLVAASLAAGPMLRGYLTRHGEQLVGRRVEIDRLKVNLFTGHVAVHGLELYEDGGEQLFASFDTLDVRARLLPMLIHTVHLKHITLMGLNVHLIRENERFNFQSMVDHFASDGSKSDTTPGDWVVKLYNICLSHAQLHYREGVQQWYVPDINLRVPGFVIGGDEGSEGGLNLGFTHGGRLRVNADYQGGSGGYALQATLTDFALKNIESLLAGHVRLHSLGGLLNAKLHSQGNLDSLMASHISGTVSLHGLDLRDTTGKVAKLKQLALQVAGINLAANRYDISRVELDGLSARFDQYRDGNTLTRMLVQKETGDPEDLKDSNDLNAAPQFPLHLHIGQLAVSDCHLTYADHTLPDSFVFPLTDISVEATDITTGGENNARLHAALPGGGHLTVNWNGNIDHWKQHQDVFLSVKGLDMKQLSPWTVYYTGQPVEDGVFGLTSRLNITHSNLDNDNKLDIYKVMVGSRRPDVEPQQKIPLKTALYILKDKDEKILIDLPIKGNIDHPEFNYMKLVWKTLGQLLVKVATSPARALGNALGLNSNDLEFIEIQPSQRNLTSEQYHVLSDLATVAKSDPRLTLTLEMRMPEAEAKHMERLNKTVRQYLMEQGLSEDRFSITAGQPTDDDSRTGYAILSEMNID